VRDAEAVQASRPRRDRARGAVDVLVNNAGILRDKTLRKMVPDDWAAVLATNLVGVIKLHPRRRARDARAAARTDREHLVVRRTDRRLRTDQLRGAKAGVIGFTRSLALELASAGSPSTRICPGFIETDMWRSIPPDVQTTLLARIPLRRTGQPEEIAALVRFLVEEGGYITGQTLNINGGIHLGADAPRPVRDEEQHDACGHARQR